MKLKIQDDIRAQLKNFVTQTSAAIATLRTSQDYIDALSSERTKSNEKAQQIETAEIPSEKQIYDLLIATKRAEVLAGLLAKAETVAANRKLVVVRAANDAMELFRRAGAQRLVERVQAELIESLPPTVRGDDHLRSSIWNGSMEKRLVSRFINPPDLSQNIEAESVISEAERRVALLNDLISGRDINVPQPSLTAEEAS